MSDFKAEMHQNRFRLGLFFTGSGNMAVSCMRSASDHNYRNSSFIVDVTMVPIPRSTERISSVYYYRLCATMLYLVK